uniref:Uncharacterized protein n=1 Tax=viral metagenome TaxID=1070528 RepID=A0A6M3L8E2_9ZZZZ
MLVKLNEKGCAALGKNKEQAVCNVSDRRAFTLMTGGLANPDHGFMARYRVDNPPPEKFEAVEETAEIEAVEEDEDDSANDEGHGKGIGSEGGMAVGQKKSKKLKKEKAISLKAEKREKAIREG